MLTPGGVIFKFNGAMFHQNNLKLNPDMIEDIHFKVI